MSHAITGSVGRGGNNLPGDVLTVQKFLNDSQPPLSARVPENGVVGSETITAIEEFQKRVVGLGRPDGRIDAWGKTLQVLQAHQAPSPSRSPTPPIVDVAAIKALLGMLMGVVTHVPSPQFSDVFSHPNADKVTLHYDVHAVPLNAKAEFLLKSILASCGMTSATLSSTVRTYQDQARITLTQTLPPAGGADRVKKWYGQAVLDACNKYKNDISGLATWWKAYDTQRGALSSNHLSNHAMDVVPSGDRAKFAAKVQELVPLKGTGVKRIIPKGVMNETVDHVEFTFEVTG
jgi:hypothetical protein